MGPELTTRALPSWAAVHLVYRVGHGAVSQGSAAQAQVPRKLYPMLPTVIPHPITIPSKPHVACTLYPQDSLLPHSLPRREPPLQPSHSPGLKGVSALSLRNMEAAPG